jgi:LPS O-antigen subunit length determinant protein (WzzB/FepE family)
MLTSTSDDLRAQFDQVTFRDLTQIAWSRRWLIAISTLICATTACVASQVLPKEYVASVLVSPVTDSQEGHLGSLSGLMSQFGGLASLAGITPATDQKRTESLAILQSAALTEQFIAQNNLLPVLYPDMWDARTHSWKTTDPAKVPTLWKANRYFGGKIRTVYIDPKTALVSVTVRWTNARQAASWANDLVAMTNGYTRQQAIDEAERNVAYLQSQAAKTDVVEVKQAIYSLLQTQINKAMIARGTEQYALKVLDPAQAPERPSSPRPILWTAAALLAGFLVSLLVAFGLGEARKPMSSEVNPSRLHGDRKPAHARQMP